MKRTLFGLVVAAMAFAANADDTMKTGFKDLDTDADGKLSGAEVRSQTMLSRDFSSADSDGDGYVSETEYASWSAKAPGDTEPEPTTDQPGTNP